MSKVTVNFYISVKGFVGGSFDMDRESFDRLRSRWESDPRGFEAEEIAEEVMELSGIGMQHLNVDEVELEEFEEEEGDQS